MDEPDSFEEDDEQEEIGYSFNPNDIQNEDNIIKNISYGNILLFILLSGGLLLELIAFAINPKNYLLLTILIISSLTITLFLALAWVKTRYNLKLRIENDYQ